MELTWPRVLIGGFTLASTVAAATWALRQDRVEELQDRLVFFEDSKHVRMYEEAVDVNKRLRGEIDKLREEIERTRLVRALLFRQAREVRRLLYRIKKMPPSEVDELVYFITAEKFKVEAQVDELNKKVSNLNHDLLMKNAYITSLSSTYASTFSRSEDFMVEEGDTKVIAGYEIVVDIVDVQSSYVDISFENKKHRITKGASIAKNTGDDICNMYLTHLHWYTSPEKASFRLICFSTATNNETEVSPYDLPSSAAESPNSFRLRPLPTPGQE